MKELSLHLLDIAMNSVRGEATKIDIDVMEKPSINIFEFSIKDNGKGIDKEMLHQIKNPFTTSRTTRKVGLGISLMDSTCKLCDGTFDISSEQGVGTKVVATLAYNHIDRPPLGDIATSLMGLFASYDQILFKYKHSYEDNTFLLDLDEIKKVLDGMPLSHPDVYQWTLNYINENINDLKKESDNKLTKTTLDKTK
ncbi:ATP-binding protein [Vallitalea okinawensis]|uniref:ATP-binding protein n=1 Tax=Vallitalea okinawensis TaxID=2078660 RepID=UPI000CFDCB73|nr:ATP-binding protein [Vallitalea okinawensis]